VALFADLPLEPELPEEAELPPVLGGFGLPTQPLFPTQPELPTLPVDFDVAFRVFFMRFILNYLLQNSKKT
jgi:hypothetical protein